MSVASNVVTRHRSMRIGDTEMFYREAGSPYSPVVLLLHGFPASSRQFGSLIPRLASSGYRVIAPDYPGFGHSSTPSPRSLYNFESLSQHVEALLRELGVERCTFYLHDYGGPVGMRIALRQPSMVNALIVQNAVSHDEGLSAAWEPRRAFWADPQAHQEAIRRALLSPEVARQRHLAGARDPEAIDPDTWTDEFSFLSRPGVADAQLRLMLDYESNVKCYPQWQSYLREHQPPLLVVWGKNDPVFTVNGALAWAKEVPGTEVHLLEGGHFVLDEHAEIVAGLIARFLAQVGAPLTSYCV